MLPRRYPADPTGLAPAPPAAALGASTHTHIFSLSPGASTASRRPARPGPDPYPTPRADVSGRHLGPRPVPEKAPDPVGNDGLCPALPCVSQPLLHAILRLRLNGLEERV